MTITIEKIGRRHYLRGTPYSAKDIIRGAGCRWDRDEQAWWTGKAATAQMLLERLAGAEVPKREAPGTEAIVAGQAEYKGRSYYLAGKVDGYGGVEPIQTRDGSRVLLYFKDGTAQFWANARITRHYRAPNTIAQLHAYADRRKAEREQATSDDTRDCYECGRAFTAADARDHEGDWHEGYCGC